MIFARYKFDELLAFGVRYIFCLFLCFGSQVLFLGIFVGSIE
jgi:hypothetical protein